MRKLLGLIIGTVAVLGIFAQPTWADENDRMREEMRLLRQRLEKQEKIINQLQNQRTKVTLDEIHQSELKDLMSEILEETKAKSAMPKWMKGLKFFGDLRLRYQYENKEWKSTGHQRNRNRARFRLRFGFTKTWWEKQMQVTFRLASGSSADSDSTNQTFDGAFSKKHVWIDLAYARYAPKWGKGVVLSAGKMKNPIRTKTIMTWDGDINPEGFHLSYQAPFLGDFKPYAAGGFFILDEESKGKDSLLWTYELGFNWKVNKDVKWFLGGTYYNFRAWDRIKNPGLDADEFYANNGRDGRWNSPGMQLLELTTKVSWKMFDMPFQAWGSWVHNCTNSYGPNNNSAALREFENENNAYAVGLKVGKNKSKGDWSAQYIFAYEELNALAQIGDGYGLSDSDFGGPNRYGHIIKAKYNLDKNITVGANLFLTRPIHTDGDRFPHNETTKFLMQLDLIWKF